MKLHIGKDHSVKEVQDEFNNNYPFLKIEFYDKSYGYRRLPAANPLFVSRRGGAGVNRSVSSSDGEIALSDLMTVSELEKKLHDQFGLSAQVFRKSGNLWMETSGTPLDAESPK